MNTPSGRPEVTIKNATKKDVTDALVSQMASQGFTIKSVSDYNVVFSKALDSFSAQLLFGSQYDVTPEHRPSFMVVETGDAVRIVLTNLIITNPGSAFERVTDASTGKAGESWQNFLEAFSKRWQGRLGIRFDSLGVIIEVFKNTPAEEAGLLIGDKIITANGFSWSRTTDMTGDPGTSIDITIQRKDQTIPFRIVRRVLKNF